MVVLSKDDPSPLAPESDEEKAEEARERTKEQGEEGRGQGPPKVKIDLEDIDQRMLRPAGPAAQLHRPARRQGGRDLLLEGPAVRSRRHAGRRAACRRPSTGSTWRSARPKRWSKASTTSRCRPTARRCCTASGDDWFLVAAPRAGQAGRGRAEARRDGGPRRPAGRVAADVPRGLAHRARLPLRPELPRATT